VTRYTDGKTPHRGRIVVTNAVTGESVTSDLDEDGRVTVMLPATDEWGSLGEMLKQIDAHHAKNPRPQPKPGAGR
jgi:hypothetical protein